MVNLQVSHHVFDPHTRSIQILADTPTETELVVNVIRNSEGQLCVALLYLTYILKARAQSVILTCTVSSVQSMIDATKHLWTMHYLGLTWCVTSPGASAARCALLHIRNTRAATVQH